MDPAPADFPDLIQAARHGDAAAQERLLADALPGLQAYVRLNADGLVLTREWSLDIAQSVCANALSALDGFSGGSESEFRAWLYKIALNKIRTRHRYLTAKRRDARRDQAFATSTRYGDAQCLATVYGKIATPSVNLSTKEAMSHLEAAMDQLSEEQRLVLTMATVLELSHREIAEQLGKQETAVRKTLSRARARLALMMAIDGGGDR